MVAGKLNVFIVFSLTVFVLAQCLLEDSNYHQLRDDWDSFKIKYEKNYESYELEYIKFKTYEKNWYRVQIDNERFEKGELSYESELNAFADLSEEEFEANLEGFLFDSSIPQNNEYDVFIPSDDEVPSEVDWRKKGAVTPVKNQGTCKSCWAFSATGTMEGQHFLKSGKLVSLSEQNLIDCSMEYFNYGCSGGLPWNAYEYVKDNHGVDTEESYPYEAMNDTCRFNPSNVGTTITGYKFVKENDEEALKKAVATVGPISVGVDASAAFMFYKSGISYNATCYNTLEKLRHAVLVVGYGAENGQDYWLVKNSWGPNWGDEGYIKMARNRDNNCGIATKASFPLI